MRLVRRDDGTTAIEYAIIAALIGIGLIGSLSSTRSSISGVVNTAATKMAGPASGNPATSGKVAYDFASQAVNSRQNFNGSQYGLVSGQTDYEFYTTNGYITYTNPANGGPERMSLADRTVNNGQTVYYSAASSGNPEQLTEVYNANGVQYNNYTVFASDGTTTTVHKEIDQNTGQADPTKTYTVTGSRSDFNYVMNQLPVARSLAGY